MEWFSRLEHKIGHLAIPGLSRVIVGLNALVFLLHKLSPSYLKYLVLDPEKVLSGEVWRLITFVFIPSWGGLLPDWLGVMLYLWVTYMFAQGVEEALGDFRFNAFYFCGMIGVTIAAFISGSAWSAAILNSSIFFAYAKHYPDRVLYVMMILPVKVKWLAWFSAVWLVIGFLSGEWDYRLAILAGLANYLLFFGREHWTEARQASEVAKRRQRFENERQPAADETLHKCTVCGRTEESAPELDFRVARDGAEYCVEHLPKPAIT